MKKFIISLLLFSFAFISYGFNATDVYANNSVIEQVKKRKVLRVAFSSFVPWAMQNKAGEFIGFEIDVATRLAKDLGVRIELKPTAWDGIIPALLTNKADVIIGGMGITEERQKQVDFTVPYDQANVALLASIEKSKNLKTLEDFNKSEITIVTVLGSNSIEILKELFPNAQIKLFSSAAICIEEVKLGRANAVLTSNVLAAFSVIDYPETFFIPADIERTTDKIAFALRKNDPETLKVFNEWIEKVKAEGWLKERSDYWFKTKDWEKDL